MNDRLQMRVMPNTPCLIGQAASAYVLGTHATDDDAQKTYALMSSVGELTTLLCTVLAHRLSASLASNSMSAKPSQKQPLHHGGIQLDRSVSNYYKQWLAH